MGATMGADGFLPDDVRDLRALRAAEREAERARFVDDLRRAAG